MAYFLRKKFPKVFIHLCFILRKCNTIDKKKRFVITMFSSILRCLE